MKESYNESVLTQEQINIIKEEYLKPLSENQIMGKRKIMKNQESVLMVNGKEILRELYMLLHLEDFRARCSY